MDSACQSYQLLLSAYVDGEANARERAMVELHLSACDKCRARVADWKIAGTLVAGRLQQQADEIDFSQFTDEVMRSLTPARPGWWERLKVFWSEIMAYHRVAVISSLATAAVTLVVAVPVAYRLAQGQAASPEVVLQELQLDDPNVKPVVMKMENGKTLIMLVNQPAPSETEAAPLELRQQTPSGGDL